MDDFVDFFISYNANDRAWAEWIAWQLEKNGFSVVIQAWDFVGNWIDQMDRAMRESRRTIAVLSPNFTNASYTQAEWKNAYRLDPTGDKDLLIPVRVAPVELKGILAQLVYVDLVGRSEGESLELLLKRARGERGKPSVSPSFPGGGAGESRARRTIATKPPFPGEAEDKGKLLRVRKIAVGWRGLYADKVEALDEAGKHAREWSREPPPQLDDKIVELINLAAEVALDFQALPLDELEFAEYYGLSIHPSVFSGQATHDVLRQASHIEPEKRAAHAAVNEELKRRGLAARPTNDAPDDYGFKMIANVLESAVALARYDLRRLPLGYLKDAGRDVSGDLSAYSNLLVATVNDEPGLQLISAGAGVERIGSFVARNLTLLALCAQRNEEGALDLVAHDFQHLYYWSSSGRLPVMQFAVERMMLDACFLSGAAGAAVATVDVGGEVLVVNAEGGRETLREASEGHDFKEARIWVDPLGGEEWHVIGLTKKHGVTSGPKGDFSISRSAEELWDAPAFLSEFEGIAHWAYNAQLTLGTLDGLPCLVVTRPAYWGLGVCFLDPVTLIPIRRPLVIREFAEGVTIAAGRWLVVALLSRGEIERRIMVFDLDAAAAEPSGNWFEERGDVYSPVVVAEDGDSFQTVQVFRTFPPGKQDWQLIRFHWPAGEVEILEHFERVRVWPVTLA